MHRMIVVGGVGTNDLCREGPVKTAPPRVARVDKSSRRSWLVYESRPSTDRQKPGKNFEDVLEGYYALYEKLGRCLILVTLSPFAVVVLIRHVQKVMIVPYFSAD